MKATGYMCLIGIGMNDLLNMKKTVNCMSILNTQNIIMEKQTSQRLRGDSDG